MNISHLCLLFYGGPLAESVLRWQIANGYDTGHVTTNWMKIADDISYFYVGDIDIQDRFALGLLTLPTSLVLSTDAGEVLETDDDQPLETY